MALSKQNIRTKIELEAEAGEVCEFWPIYLNKKIVLNSFAKNIFIKAV